MPVNFSAVITIVIYLLIYLNILLEPVARNITSAHPGEIFSKRKSEITE